MRIWRAAVLAGMVLAGSVWGDGGMNQPPPAGAILDLNGTPIPGGGDGATYQQYTVTFVAAISNTAITFAFRDDPAGVNLEEFSVVDQTVSGPNLLVNGDLTGGVYTNSGNSGTPVGWTYANLYGASAGGGVETGCGGPQALGICWQDGAVGAYDAISQTIPTVIGHTYQISFYLAESSDCGCDFSSLATGGGDNGIDVLAYALSSLPSAGGAPATPAPGTLWLLLIGLAAAFGWTERRRIHDLLFGWR